MVETCSPPLGFQDDQTQNEAILGRIAAARPDVLIVGLGAPKQELWVHAHRERIAAPVALCVGATIDFLAGQVARAPELDATFRPGMDASLVEPAASARRTLRARCVDFPPAGAARPVRRPEADAPDAACASASAVGEAWQDGRRLSTIRTPSKSSGVSGTEAVEARNVICLVIDGLQPAYLGAYGNTWIATHELDRLAAESFVCDAALADTLDLAADLSRLVARIAGDLAQADEAEATSLIQRANAAGWQTALITDDRQVAELPAAAGFHQGECFTGLGSKKPSRRDRANGGGPVSSPKPATG